MNKGIKSPLDSKGATLLLTIEMSQISHSATSTAGATLLSYAGCPRFLASIQIWSDLVRESSETQNRIRKSKNIPN